MNNKGLQKEKGFILVTVMLLTMVGSTLVLTSLQDTTVQERLSGNFQKNMNSRMLAEQGVYASITSMEETLAANTDMTIEELVAVTASTGISGSDSDGNKTYGVIIEQSDSADDEIIVYSTGNVYEGQVNMKAIYSVVTGSSASSFPYASGVTACEEAVLAASGDIDSYNSAEGDYSEETSSDNITLETLLDGPVEFSGAASIDGNVIASSHLTFSGGADISGDVEVGGNFTFTGGGNIGGNISVLGSYTQTNGTIGGNVHADGDVLLPQGGNGTIQGNVKTRGNYTQYSSTINGYIQANGDISLPSQPTVDGAVYTLGNYLQTGGTVGAVYAVGDVEITQWGSIITDDDLLYAGTGTFQGDHSAGATQGEDYTTSVYSVSESDVLAMFPTPSTVAEVVLSNGVSNSDESTVTTCDPYDIASEISEVSTVEAGEDLGAVNLTVEDGGTDYVFSKYQGYFESTDGTKSETISSVFAEFMDEDYQMLMYEDVFITGDVEVYENQDVTIYVKGDFTMSGSGSLTIPDGSSLTLIIEGKFNLNAESGSAQVYTPDNGVTDSGLPVFTIFSSYASASDDDYGVSIANGTDEVYAVVYAPLTNVYISSGVDFKGSILGNRVDLSGAGDIHYDEALAGAGIGESASADTYFVFKGWEYITEDDIGNTDELDEEEESTADESAI